MLMLTFLLSRSITFVRMPNCSGRRLRYDSFPMVKTRSSIIINRPLSEVWNFLMDLHNYSLWAGGGGNMTATYGLQAGSILTIEYQHMGKPYTSEIEITANDGFSRYTAHATRGPIDFNVTYSLAEEGRSTRLTVDTEGEASAFMKLAEPVIKQMSQTRQDANLQILKTVLEGQVSEIAS